MALNLVNNKEKVLFGEDSIVIAKYGFSLPGGRDLVTTGFPESVIKAGHIIIKASDGTYKPMPLTAGETSGTYVYGSLPEGASYAGVLYRSILTAKPAASILVEGAVNEAALPYAITSIKTAFCAAVPGILFIKDEPKDVPSA